jgi:hypothetical protein
MTIKSVDWADRRTTTRKHFVAKGWLRLTDGRQLEARTFDASLTGAGVAHSDKVPMGARVLLALSLMGNDGQPHAFQAEAEVRHTMLCSGGEWHTGVLFCALTPANHELLQQSLSRKVAWVD